MVEPAASSNNIRIGRITFYYGWIILIACLLLVTMSYGIRFSYGVFFKSLEQDFGWTRALTSEVFSVYMLLCALFAIIGGWASDRYGARIVFIVMGLSSFAGLALTSLAGTLWHLFASYSILVAAGTGPGYALANSLAARWFLKRRGLAAAIVTSGVGLGSILVVPLAAYFVENYQWRSSFVIIGIISLIVMVICSLFIKRSPDSSSVTSVDNRHETSDLHPEERAPKEEGISFHQVIHFRNFWIIFIMWFFYAFCLFTIMTHIVPYAMDSGIDPIQAAFILSISGIANMPSRILTGIISDRFGRKKVALTCALLMVISMFWLTRSSSLWMLYVFGAVFGAAYGGLAPPLLAIIGDTFGVRNIGVIFGFLEVGWVTGAAAGPAFAGHIFDSTGKYDLAFVVCLLSAIIIFILNFFVKVSRAK